MVDPQIYKPSRVISVLKMYKNVQTFQNHGGPADIQTFKSHSGPANVQTFKGHGSPAKHTNFLESWWS